MTAIERLAMMNYGHFTTMVVRDGRVHGLTRHLRRLVRDAEVVFGAPLDTGEVRERIRAAVAGADGPCTVRVTVVDPDLTLERPGAPARPQLVVTTRPAVPGPLPPLRLRSVNYQRDLPAVKHTGLFGSLHQRRRAQAEGYDDAVFTDPDGLILEGATWNIGFCHRDGEVVWPVGPALPGVTAALLHEAYGGRTRREPVALSGLHRMAAAFATNAAGGVRPIAALDGVQWPVEHPALELLRRTYAAIDPEVA